MMEAVASMIQPPGSTTDNAQPLCSVVLSVYNEESNLRLIYERLADVAAAEPNAWEFIFVDDGSDDRS